MKKLAILLMVAICFSFTTTGFADTGHIKKRALYFKAGDKFSVKAVVVQKKCGNVEFFSTLSEGENGIFVYNNNPEDIADRAAAVIELEVDRNSSGYKTEEVVLHGTKYIRFTAESDNPLKIK